MPKLDDPNFKLRLPTTFVRKNLRPWNIIDELQDISDNEDIQNSKQLANNNESNIKHIVNNNESNSKPGKTKSKQTVNPQKTISNQISKQLNETNSKQKAIKLVNNYNDYSLEEEIYKLSGLQRKLLIFIIENCSSRGLLQTTPITSETLKLLLETDEDSAKTTVQRLVNKGILSRVKGRRGRGGFCILRITEEVRNIALEFKRQISISEQIVNQLVTKSSNHLVNNKETNKVTTLSSSSSNINTTTTTRQSQDSNNESQLSSEWEEIEIAPLEDIGFSKHHLKQIANQNKISYTEVQESINAFAFDLKQNGKAKHLKTNPLNYFMGILRNESPYAPPSNYKSQKEIEMEQYLARKKEEKERIKKLEDEIIHQEFEEWLQTITDIQRNEIVGELQQSHMYTDKVKESVAKSRLFDHFKQNVRSTIEKS